MRGFEALTWCHDQGRRFGSYHAQAAARPWPRATALWAPERGLLVAGAGAGGGAQQALFREELQAYLQAGLARWPEGSDLGAYFYAVQAAFDAATAVGLEVEIGPFGTAIDGDDELVVETVATVLRAALRHGATRVSVQVETTEP